MKTINETFDDDEIAQLEKQKGKSSWHDYIMGMSDLIKSEDNENDTTSTGS